MEAMKKQRVIYVERIENEEDKTYYIKVHYPDDVTVDEMKGTLQREIERSDLLTLIQDRLWFKFKWTNRMLLISALCNALMLMLFYWR